MGYAGSAQKQINSLTHALGDVQTPLRNAKTCVRHLSYGLEGVHVLNTCGMAIIPDGVIHDHFFMQRLFLGHFA